ncbi:MAG TPA: glycogen synthase [Desulfobacterales bacterium]
MNILLLTNEYPPNIYGGAGVHVDHLTRELQRIEKNGHRLQVFSFGDQQIADKNLAVKGIAGTETRGLQPAKIIDTLYRNLIMTGSARTADIVHCHTWYTHLAGCLIQQMLQIPLVVTVHSLEPHRPWKKEQLGNGYHASRWLEKTALLNADGIIAVSQSMQQNVQTLYGIPADRIRVIYNGIDTARYRRIHSPETLAAYGIDPDRPYILFVGRITRQKGILHLVNAIPHLTERVQVVLCAGAPDTEAIAAEMQQRVAAARARTANHIVWIADIVPVDDLVALYSHAALFVCPSVYEPFGIINLEAMACGTPVVASAVGGIREVVVSGETGMLVPLTPKSVTDAEPRDPHRFAHDLAAAVNELLAAPEKRRSMAAACRRRVERHFSWQHIARQTLNYYLELTSCNSAT